MISNYIASELTHQVIRLSASVKTRISVTIPAMVKEYKSFMGAIDLHDMLV